MKLRLAITALVIASPALAEPTSEEYALMARKAASVWACAALADYTGNNTDATRLFSLGYESGKTFVEAVKAKKINREDWSNHVPMIFGGMMNGPSADFAVGRMYEAMLSGTIKGVWDASPVDQSDGALKYKARDMYQKQNCSLLK
jgi:hypothetical protein